MAPTARLIMHFTHVSHLTAITQIGLLGDSTARTTPSFKMEAGNLNIKEQRRRRTVPVPPGGVVADYAPFYFAPRSPMMYAIARGNVPTYQGTCDELVYLVSTVERITELRLPAIFTDRNSALRIATFSNNPADLDSMIDWDLMKATYWHNTDEEPDRRERRMAECLIHDRVPWAAFLGVVAKNEGCALQARTALDVTGASTTVVVRPGWYF